MNKQNVQAIYPLTSTQSALLYHCVQPDRPDPGFLQVRFSLRGNLNEASLSSAWQRVAQRHEAMRMSLRTLKSQKQVLVVKTSCEIDVNWHDLRRSTTAEQRTWIENFCDQDRSKGLDLNLSPVTRLSAIRKADDLYEVIWSCHHLLLDGWSATVILRDLMSFYQAQCAGVQANLAKIPSLGDYLGWLNQQSDAESSAYWKNYLRGFSNPVSFSDFRRDRTELDPDALQAEPFVTRQLDLPAQLGTQIQQAARNAKITPAAIVYAAWSLIVSSIGDVDDVVFGTTDAGRSFDLPERESIAGYFSNVVPVRSNILPTQTFRELAQSLHESTFGRRHNSYPTGAIQLCSELDGRQNLFETLLVYENLPSLNLQVPVDGGLTLTDFAGGITTTHPLTIVIKPGATWEIEYTFENGLSETEISAVLTSFGQLLVRCCGDTGASVNELQVALCSQVPKSTQSATSSTVDQEPTSLASNQTELEIAKIWEELLGVVDVDLHTEFIDLGGRSILAVRMVAMIEERLGKRISFVDLVEQPTIAGLANRVADGDCSQRWTSLLPIKPRGSKPPLISVHAGGEHGLFLRTLIPHMLDDQPIFGFQSVGLNGECAPMSNMEQIAGHYVDELLTVQTDGPYFLAGHCIGARVALEMAQQLKRQGKEVPVLIILDTTAPKTTPLKVPSRKKTLLQQWTNFLHGDWGEVAKYIVRGTKFVSRAIARTCGKLNRRRALAFGSRYSKKVVYMRQVQDAGRIASSSYVPETYDGKIVFVQTSSGPLKGQEWKKISSDVEILVVPIDHVRMFFEPDVQVLAETLTRVISEAQEKRANSANKSLELKSSS